MAFELAVIAVKPASVGTGIKVSLKKVRGGPARLCLSFSAQTVAALSWSDRDRIVVQIGTGEHHGLIRLQKNNSAGQVEFQVKVAGRGGAYGYMNLGSQAAFVDRSEESRWCQWEKLDSGEIEIVLPKWADETGRKQARPAAVGSTLPPQSIPRKTETVTAALMGDPPPGRSALSERKTK